MLAFQPEAKRNVLPRSRRFGAVPPVSRVRSNAEAQHTLLRVGSSGSLTLLSLFGPIFSMNIAQKFPMDLVWLDMGPFKTTSVRPFPRRRSREHKQEYL